MFIGVADLFKVGIGPSSSHTVGPMNAARLFLGLLAAAQAAGAVAAPARALRVRLYGSLALTGRGHGTDTAIVAGLTGAAPDTVDPDALATIVAEVTVSGGVSFAGNRLAFDPRRDLVFEGGFLPSARAG